MTGRNNLTFVKSHNTGGKELQDNTGSTIINFLLVLMVVVVLFLVSLLYSNKIGLHFLEGLKVSISRLYVYCKNVNYKILNIVKKLVLINKTKEVQEDSEIGKLNPNVISPNSEKTERIIFEENKVSEEYSNHTKYTEIETSSVEKNSIIESKDSNFVEDMTDLGSKKLNQNDKEKYLQKSEPSNKIIESSSDDIIINSVIPKTENNEINSNKYLIIGASSIGKGHIKKNEPCQDSFYYEKINDFWSISVVSDGAGSKRNSQYGSKFVSEEAVKAFKDLILERKWTESQFIPSEEEWKKISLEILKKVLKKLNNYAKEVNFELSSLSATIIVTIQAPFGLLTCHIGDGRACYLSDNKWKSSMIPYKGEEANSTVFITSKWYENPDKYFESRVIKENIASFALMTDGCEMHTYNCSKMDEITQKWQDPNEPFDKFFNNILKAFNKMIESNLTENEMSSELENHLENGSEGLKKEYDDKTMIIGLLINKNT